MKSFILVRLKKFEEVVECSNRALKIDPKLANVWTDRGSALFELGQYEEAMKCYDNAIEIDPKKYLTLYEKGECLSKLKKYDEAMECFDKALKIKPGDTGILQKRSEALLKKTGRFVSFEDMKKMLAELIGLEKLLTQLELLPYSATELNNSGVLLAEQGTCGVAIKYFDIALEINPELREAWNNKGLALEHLGKIEEAKECFEKIGKRSGNFILAVEQRKKI